MVTRVKKLTPFPPAYRLSASSSLQVAIDTLDHVEASDNWSNAARSYRLAGQCQLKAAVVDVDGALQLAS